MNPLPRRVLYMFLLTAGCGIAAWFARHSIAEMSRAVGFRPLVLVLIVVIMVGTSLWLLPKLQVAALKNVLDDRRFELENDARTTLAQILGGAFLLLGLLATWTTIRDSETTIRMSERGQFTERFTKAVNQIGDKQLDVRLGGIFALEGLAKESAQDRGSITQVLTAFVRVHAPITAHTGHRVCADVKIPLTPKGHLRAEADTAAETWPPADVQAVLTILGKGEITQDVPPLQLGESDLGCAYLPEADFSHATFQRTHFENAWLPDVRFDTAVLMGAVMTNARLDGATFAGADLTASRLGESLLVNCDNLAKAKFLLGADLPPLCNEARRKQSEEEQSVRKSATAP